MLDTVVISGDDVCCSVVFGTLVGVFVFSVMWSELLMTSAISSPLWSSVYESQRMECAFTSPVRTECGMFVLSRLDVLHVCNCDMFNVVNVYLDHLQFCVVCIDGRRYVCCSECNVVSNECNEPTSCLGQPIVTHGGEVMYFECGCFRMRGVGGVCEMCMCLARGGKGGEGGEWMRGLCLSFTNPVGTGGVLDVCVFWLRWRGWCR